MDVNQRSKLTFPYEIQDLSSTLNEELKSCFRGFTSGFVQIGPEKWFFPKKYKDDASNIYNFKVRSDDVWIVTFPRSGTTVTQEMIWLIANDLDYKTALEVSMTERFPFLEYHILFNQKLIDNLKNEHNKTPEIQAEIDEATGNKLNLLESQTTRRFIKTHLPFSLLPPDLLAKGAKVVYVARNPLDVVVSYYHLQSAGRNSNYVGDFQKFWNYFKQNLVTWSPYWNHVKEGYNRRNEKNLLFLFYEDLIINLPNEIKRMADFFEKSLTPEEIVKLANHLKIENFKNNQSVNRSHLGDLGLFDANVANFVREGRAGGWRGHFNDKEAKEEEEWVKENQKTFGVEFKI